MSATASATLANEPKNMILPRFKPYQSLEYDVAYVCGSPRIGIFREMIKELNANYDLDGTLNPISGNTDTAAAIISGILLLSYRLLKR
jgi:hypothetical protein